MNNSLISQTVSEQQQRTLLNAVLSSIQECANLSQVLRTGGALLVAAAMSLFLLEGWSRVDDLKRLYMMLGQTLVLSIIGFGLSVVLKEQKGARVFCGLGILSVLASMTTLGALTFSSLQGITYAEDYPIIAQRPSMDIASLTMTISLAFIIAIPLLLFAFSVMARPIAKPLTLVFMATSVLLLIPLRDSLSIIAIVAIAGLIPFTALKYLPIKEYAFKTLEARFAIATLFLPLLIIVIRYFWLYSMDQVAILMMCSLVFSSNYVVITQLKESIHWFKSILDWCCVLLGACMSVAITNITEQWLSLPLTFSSISFMFVIFSVCVAQQSKSFRSVILVMAALQLLAWHALIILFVDFSQVTLFLCTAASISTMGLAKTSNQSLLFVLGALVFVLMVLMNIIYAFGAMAIANWMMMIVMGVAVIISASIIERYGAAIKLTYEKWFSVKS